MKRTARFLFRRFVLALVNLLAGPPDIAWLQGPRRALLRCLGLRLGPRVQLSEQLYIYDGRNVEIGAGSRLGAFAKIWDFCPIRIGRDLLASHNLTLISATHENDAPRTNRPGPITIGDNVWIGINVTLVGPVTVGDNVIIGAHSLVLSDLAANGIYAGTPAKLIRALK